MEIRHFKKDFIQNFVSLNGKKIGFEPISSSIGVLALDDTTQKDVVDFLDSLSDAKKKGVRRISPEQYDSLKKNPPRQSGPQSALNELREFKPQEFSRKSNASSPDAVPAAGNPPPTPVFTQRVTPPAPTAPAEEAKPVEPPAPVKPRTMRKSKLKEFEAQQPE